MEKDFILAIIHSFTKRDLSGAPDRIKNCIGSKRFIYNIKRGK